LEYKYTVLLIFSVGILTSWAYYLYLSLIFKNFTAGIFKPLIKKINMEVNTTENKTLEQDYRDLAGLLSNIVDSLPIYFFVKIRVIISGTCTPAL